MVRIQSAYIIAQGPVHRCPVYSSLFTAFQLVKKDRPNSHDPRLRFYNCISFSVDGILSEIFSNNNIENAVKVVPVFIAVLASAHPHAACHETVTNKIKNHVFYKKKHDIPLSMYIVLKYDKA